MLHTLRHALYISWQQKIDRLASDTGLKVGDIKTVMNDIKGWKEFVQAKNRKRSTSLGKLIFLENFIVFNHCLYNHSII